METLAAVAIVTVCMAGSVSMYFGMMNMVNRASVSTIAQEIARRRIEEARNVGFANLAEGTSTTYYGVNGDGGSTTKASTDLYSATTVVTSDIIAGGVVDKTALRTVVVTVKRLSDSKVLETTGAYLAWGGV